MRQQKNLVSQRNALGERAEFFWDALNRPVRIQWPGAVRPVELRWVRVWLGV